MLKTRIERVFDPNPLVTTDLKAGDRLADCRSANRVCFIIENGLNQSVSVRVLGNDGSGSSSAIPVNTTPIVIDANSRQGIGIKTEEWMPFMGVDITPAVAPTDGRIQANAHIQEYV